MLVGSICLALLSAVAFSTAIHTKKIEQWESEYYEQQRLQQLARSAVIAVGEKLYQDNYVGASDAALTAYYNTAKIDKKGTVTVKDDKRDNAVVAYLTVSVSADAGAEYIKIKAIASNDAFKDDKEIKISGRCLKSADKIVTWSDR